jgi:hypothetical protein
MSVSSTAEALPLIAVDELGDDAEFDSCLVHVHNEELTRRREIKQTNE